MVNIKNTLDELKAIISELETEADKATAWDATAKANLQKRLAHVLDKSNPRHTNLTVDLETDLKEIENINKMIGDEKLRTDAEIKKLTDEKTKLEGDITAKDALLKEKDEAIGGKITKDLIDKLEAVSKMDLKKQPKKNADGTDMKDKDGNIIYEEVVDLSPLKTLLEDIKTKGAKADLTDITTKIDTLTATANEIKEAKGAGKDTGTNYWSMGAAIGSGICTLLLFYLAFKSSGGNTHNSTSSSRQEEDIN